MRTKVVDSRELWEGVKSVTHVQEAIGYRVGDLTSISSSSLSHSRSLTLSQSTQTTFLNKSWTLKSSSKILLMEW